MALTNFGFSSSYPFLDQALRSRWEIHRALELEMDSFVPRPASDYQPLRAAEVDRLRVLNPESPLQDLERLVDGYFAPEELQFCNQFDARHMSEYIIITVLAQALAEAMINTILAIGLANAGASELFSLLENAEFKQKWIVGPKAFCGDYSFPIGTAIHETLSILAKQRNSLVHNKVSLSVENDQVLKGSLFQRVGYIGERRWIKRFFSLPYDLMEFAADALPDLPLSGLLHKRSPILKASEHIA